MQEDHLRELLLRLPDVDRVGRSGEDFLTIPCAVAGWRHASGRDRRPSMAVSITEGISFAHCFSCGYTKPFVDMLFDINTNLGGLAELAIEAQKIEQNRPFKMIGSVTKIETITDYTEVLDELYQHPWSEKSIEFLESKGVTLDAAKKFSCAFAPKSTELVLPDGSTHVVKTDTMVFPVKTLINEKWVCVGAQARAVDPAASYSKYYAIFPFKGANYFFGEQLLYLRKDLPIILVEGALDAIHLGSDGFRSVALMGTALQDAKIKKLLTANPKYVIILLDPDAAGTTAAKVIKNALLKHGLQCLYRIPQKDPKYLQRQDLLNLLNERPENGID